MKKRTNHFYGGRGPEMGNGTNGREAGKTTVRFLNSLVDFLFLAILILLLVFAVYSLWDSNKVYSDADSQQYATYKPTAKDTTSFKDLQEMNSDVFGWLTVYGTKIDYPLVQSDTSNEEYLDKNAKGGYDMSGSIFLDHRNHKNFSDFNTLIYGHHMAHRAMFGDLDKFLKRGFFQKHQYGNLYYSGKNHGVEFFAMLQVDAYDYTLYSPGITGKAAQDSYIAYLKQKAMYWRGTEVSAGDHLILLSTCSADITNGRFILVGKILDHTVKNPYPNEVKANRGSGADASSFWRVITTMPTGLLILILLILLILTCLLYRTVSRRQKQQQKESRKMR